MAQIPVCKICKVQHIIDDPGFHNQKVLEKAIQKAIDGGWDYKKDVRFNFGQSTRLEWFSQDEEPEMFIYRHDFAKALWGNEKITRRRYVPDYYHLGEYILEPEASTKPTNAWKYHLQQMVIDSDPIKYLGDSI